MGMIFYKTLKCENCGYEYHGKSGGNIIGFLEGYDISQYYCNTCDCIIDLKRYHSYWKENIEKYTYPNGAEVSYERNETEEYDDGKYNPEKSTQKLLSGLNNTPPFCQKCGSHLFRISVPEGEKAYCPICGHKSLKVEDLHLAACVD